jgi:hypothetical protein
MTRFEMDDVFFEMEKLVIDCKVGNKRKDEAIEYLKLSYFKAENKIKHLMIVWGSDEADELARSWNEQIPTNEELSEKLVAGYQNFKKQIEDLPVTGAQATPSPSDAQAPEMTDDECLKILASTGYIKRNTNIKNKIIYELERAVTAPDIYNKLLIMTNDGKRAERIMRNNMSGADAGLKQYLYRLSKRNKSNIQ